MAAVTVTCYTDPNRSNYHKIASAMAAGIQAQGDLPSIVPATVFRPADVGLIYGWNRRHLVKAHNKFLYADCGYWNRDKYWRFAANDWSPASSMRKGMPPDRWQSLGVNLQPEHDGRYVLVLGASSKSMAEHGLRYLQWERKTCEHLRKLGATVLYRPKPRDRTAREIPGTKLVKTQPIQELFAEASMVVAHHSNGCVEAIAAGCAVHCNIGVAQPRSVPLNQWRSPPRIPDREQFLADVAYTQWTLEEMRTGEAWKHLRDGVLQ